MSGRPYPAPVAPADTILAAIAHTAGFEVADLTGYSRGARLVEARREAMHALWLAGYTHEAIGQLLGGRNHSTVTHHLGLHLARQALAGKLAAGGARARP